MTWLVGQFDVTPSRSSAAPPGAAGPLGAPSTTAGRMLAAIVQRRRAGQAASTSARRSARAWVLLRRRPGSGRRGAILIGATLGVLGVAAAIAVALVLQRQLAPGGGAAPVAGPSLQRIEVISGGVLGRDDEQITARWTSRLGSELKAEVVPYYSDAYAYLAEDDTDSYTFVAQQQVQPDASMVVLVGGVEPADSSIDVITAATKAIDAVRVSAPDARIVVVGPSENAANAKTALRSAAALAEVDWVDPGSWLRGSRFTSGGALTEAGADRFASDLAAQLTD